MRMRWTTGIVAATALVAMAAVAQDTEQAPAPLAQAGDRATVVIPAGTKVPLRLEHGISTNNARVGDGVYARTTFPVAIDDRIVLPAGTYVQGEIGAVKRAGRVHGKAEVLVHFRTMIYPSGYTVSLPGAVESAPDAENSHVNDKEGTVQQNGDTGKKVGTAAKTAAEGAIVGAVVDRGIRGAAIGGGMGAAVGTVIGLLTRGNEVRLAPGTTLEMVFERSVTLDAAKLGGNMGPGAPGAPRADRRLPQVK